MADKEKISALMDGELVDKALLKELELDTESQQTWQDYHLIGDVMRHEEPQSPEWDIASRVAAALEDEPTHSTFTAPVENRAPLTDPTPIEAQPTPQQAKQFLPSWLRNFGQVGIAACVSLAVVLGVQQPADDASPQNNQLPVLQTVPFAGSVEPVSLTRESVEPSASEASLTEQRKRVHAMLRDYELQLRLNSVDENASSEDTVDTDIK